MLYTFNKGGIFDIGTHTYRHINSRTSFEKVTYNEEHGLLEARAFVIIISSTYLSHISLLLMEGLNYPIYTWKFNFLPFLLQINDRYEFPLQLDLDRDNGKYLSPDADRNVRNLYTLHR